MDSNISNETLNSGGEGLCSGEKNQQNFSGKNVFRRRLPDAVQTLEKQLICEALERSLGNQRMAAEFLGITKRMLSYRLKQYGIRVFKNSLRIDISS